MRQDTKAFLKGDLKEIPLDIYGLSVQEGTPAKTNVSHLVIPPTEQVQVIPQKKEEKNTVDLQHLQWHIQNIIGETIFIGRLKKLVQTAGVERISYHLKHWHIHKLHVTKSVAGYFLTVVENDIPPQALPKQQYHTGKIPQRDNFEQHVYTDEELERVYADLSQ